MNLTLLKEAPSNVERTAIALPFIASAELLLNSVLLNISEVEEP